ncbi:Protein CBG03746 [Caenorhabditis briggsae]|uniref:Protein CBG03746 n=2 Tax=Caenorhabditis briggsae TaxID=6238 RepID=A8WWM2_CAEBR|nr:Protein CBG03746 [Caenorhabditis briggsae]CAP24589.1 Protein CBG03746 [Caenorhabditis briggsae]
MYAKKFTGSDPQTVRTAAEIVALQRMKQNRAAVVSIRTLLRTSSDIPTTAEKMTAMREARGDSASADPLNGARSKINDRKFAFLNQITHPDYRSLPTSAAASQSSVPSTPVTIPLKSNGAEQIIFREFGAPIATPEDEELLDDLEIKSEPVLSPRRAFTDFGESEEKENREEDTDADTTIREDIDDVRKCDDVEKDEYDDDECIMKTSESNVQEDEDIEEPMKNELENEEVEEEPTLDESVTDSQIEEIIDVKPEEERKSPKIEPIDFIRMVESAPELSNPFRASSEKQEVEAEEIRKMTESYGEPRKAVLHRVYDTVEETDEDETETETETETENEDMDEDVDDDVRRQIAAVSDVPMVFGWNGSKREKMEKPTSLPLHYEVEADCSTPRRAEFSINPDDDTSSEDPTTQSTSSSAEEGVLQQSLLQLQKQLRKTDVRCSRLEKICEFQQRDIDSLRFEVDWKDKRIEYLQKTLQEMESSSQADASTARSTSTS